MTVLSADIGGTNFRLGAVEEDGSVVKYEKRPTAAVFSLGRVLKDLDNDVLGRDVIIVEDIVDSGVTLNYLKGMLQHRGAASICIVTLLDKPERRRVKDLKVDYSCFNIPDEFVVGYGLDYDQAYRNLPDIGVLSPKVYEKR